MGLRHYLFEPLSDETLADIENRIQTQVRNYLSYLTLDAVTALGDPVNENLVKVEIRFSIDSIDLSDVLFIELDYSALSVVSDTMGVNY